MYLGLDLSLAQVACLIFPFAGNSFVKFGTLLNVSGFFVSLDMYLHMCMVDVPVKCVYCAIDEYKYDCVVLCACAIPVCACKLL